MTNVASRELRNNTRAVLARVEAGESITITVDGRPVATIEPRSGTVARARPGVRPLACSAQAGPGLLRGRAR
ncbi:MAG: type II toxin-antitoxin system prevent-host-death family antitoxin [Candidatus Limnocylindrales bacterium]